MERDGLGEPEQERSGPDVEKAVASAEERSPVEGVHTAPGDVDPGEARAERVTDADGTNESHPDTAPD